MAFHCKEHGKIRKIGNSKANFCPLCGKEVTPIFFIPKIYIETAVVKSAGVILCLCLIVYGLRSCNYDFELESTKQLKLMNPTWRSLYEQLNAVSFVKEHEVCENFIKTNAEKLKSGPALKPFEIKLIMGVCAGDKDKVLQALQPYTVDSDIEKK